MSAVPGVVDLHRSHNQTYLDITIHPDMRQFDETATALLVQCPQVTTFFLNIMEYECLRNWPRLLGALEMRGNLHKLSLFVLLRHGVSPAEFAILLQTLQRNTNIREFSLFCGKGLQVASLLSFLNASSTRLTAITLNAYFENSDTSIDGPKDLAASLKRFTNLQHLGLGGRVKTVQWRYAVAILDSLGRNHPVQTLEISLDQHNWCAWDSLEQLVGRTSNLRKLVINCQMEISEGTRTKVLKMAKSNFSLREITFEQFGFGLAPKDQQSLQFYANRNKHMDQWIDQTALVPKHLWPNTLTVAAQASVPNVLFRSLLAIKGDLGKIRSKRKHKRPDHFQPS